MSTTYVHYLTWDELCEAPAVEELEPPRRLVEARIVEAAERDDHGSRLDALEEDLDRILIEHCGIWAAGWRWACSEPGGGGLVRAWCCPRDSLLRDGESPAVSVERVLAALTDWCEVIAALARAFERLEPDDDADIAEVVEHAAASLVAWVVERTDATDAWYQTLAAVLVWYLQAWALDDEVARAHIGRVVSGRFESWIAPDEALVRSASAELGRTVAEELERAQPDATLAWISIRRTAFKPTPDPLGPAVEPGDGHRRFIEGRERSRDAARAERMLAALDTCRRAARDGRALDWDLLARLNALALGRESSDHRRGDAFAKSGRERYAGTEETFVAYLAEANDERVAWCVRAARVYLDVCFFHPFADANARTARLALDWVLTRAGVTLHVAEPVFVIARAANDSRGAWRLAWLIACLSTHVARSG